MLSAVDVPLSKQERQRLVASIVTRRRVGTQQELLAELAAAGCRVTQATVSRDIRELRLEKEPDALGRLRYVLPQARGDDAESTLHGLLGQFGRRVTAAQNLVVLESELGSAPAIARALDRLGHRRVVGTLAGDDTCLVVAASADDAESLAQELGGLLR